MTWSPVLTSRLRLRRFEPRDTAAFHAYRNDPEIARYQSWEGISEADARAFVASQALNQPDQLGSWVQLAIAHLESDELLGDCALFRPSEAPETAEIGYSLARAWQGRGLAGEAVGGLLGWLFKSAGVTRVTACSDTRNLASLALLERLGFEPCERMTGVWFKGALCDEVRMGLSIEQWAR